MYKSRRYYYRKTYQRPFPWLWLLPAIPLVLLFLEVALRLVVGITGNGDELAVYEGEPEIVTAYRLKFLDQNRNPYDGLSDRGQLGVQRRLAGGYGLVGNQTSQFWRINEQGFREDKPIPVEKPKDEIRIFLLGGSTAFGQGNANNQATIARKLEARLNERIAQQRRSPEKYRPAVLPYYKPELVKALALPLGMRDGQYRVINAAVPGYTSGNQLAQLALQILPYSPDAIVVLDGYADLMLPSNKVATDIPHVEAFLDNSLGHLWAHLTRQLKQSLTDSYLVKAPQYWFFNSQPSASRLSLLATDEKVSLERQLAADSAELDRRVARYRVNHKQMVRLLAGSKIPLVIAVQPEITGRGQAKLSPREQEILEELGPVYRQRAQTGYAELVQASEQLKKAFPQNVKTINFYNAYEGFPNQAFNDAIHLTEDGNALLSEQMYHVLTGLPKLQVTPPKVPK